MAAASPAKKAEDVPCPRMKARNEAMERLPSASGTTPEIAALSFDEQVPYKLKQGRPPLGV